MHSLTLLTSHYIVSPISVYSKHTNKITRDFLMNMAGLTLSLLSLTSLFSLSHQMEDLFEIHKDKSPVSLTSIKTLRSSPSLSCHGACLRHPVCMAFMTSSGDECNLYNKFITDQNTQLQTQTGANFYNVGEYRHRQEQTSIMSVSTDTDRSKLL